MELKLEMKDQENPVKDLEKIGISITPPIGEGYWLYRVRLSENQAIVAFPKFFTIGIGFEKEEDWNTNLPYTCTSKEIFDHIKHNKGDSKILDRHCIAAIEIIQYAIKVIQND